jgi:uncharacterized protein with HEPN domain
LLPDDERLEHILESIHVLAEYVLGADLERLLTNRMMQDAIIRRLTIIGEAATNLSAGLKSRYSDVPWRLMADLRNVIVHEYHRVDWQIVWDVVTRDLPPLAPTIETVASDLQGGD